MSERHPSFLRLDLHYIALQCGFWAMFGSIAAYQASLLLSRGLTNSDVGLVIAARCLAGFFSQPLLGQFSDRHPQIPLKYVLALSLGISLVAGALFLAVPMGLGGTLACFAIMGAFELSAYPLIDSLAIQYINDGVPLHYSLGRGLGSCAYAVCCALLGLATAALGMEVVLRVHTALVVTELLLVLTFPTHRPKPGTRSRTEQKEAPLSPGALLASHPRFAVTLLSSMFMGIGTLSLSSFLVNIVGSRGGGSQELGVALFMMGVAELPSAILFPKLKRRLGTSGLFTLAMLFCAMKCLAFLLAPNVAAVCGAQLFQTLGYGLFVPTSVFFVNENVPAADKVQGQSLMMVFSNALGPMLGSMLMGRVLDAGGVDRMLLFCLLSCLLATLLAFLAQRLPVRRTLPVKENVV